MIPDLRLQNILSQIGQPSPTSPDIGAIDQSMLPSPQPTGQQQPNDEQEMMHRLQMMFNPSYAMQQQLQQHIANMPQRAQYKPSKMRQFAGILSNLGSGGPSTYYHGAALGYQPDIAGGIAAQRAINEAPYNRALGDWETKLAPLEKIAGIESAHNVNERNIANSILMNAVREGQLRRQQERDVRTETEKERHQKETEDIAKQNLKVREARSKTYEAKAHGATIRVSDDGNLIGTDPITLKTQILTYDDGTPIKSQHLSDADKINLQIEGRLKGIAATGEEQRKTEDLKQTGRTELEGIKQPTRIQLKQTIPSKNLEPVERPSISPKELTPAAAATDKVNKAIQIINDHPEYKKYFVYGGNKKPTGEMIPPQNWIWKTGEDKTNYESARKLLAGEPSIRKPTESETIQMKHPVEAGNPMSGKVGPVKRADVEMAKKAGYTEVK